MKVFDLLVSDLCEEIDFLRHELKRAKDEADDYRNKYNDILSSSITHSNKMMVNMLDILLTEGVAEKYMVKKEQN